MSTKTVIEAEIQETMKIDLLEMDIIISNITSTFNIGGGVVLDLGALVMRGINMEYKGGHYLRYMIRDPAVTANIYPSGKVFLIGNTSEAEARQSSRRVARTLQKLITRYPGEVCKMESNFSPGNMRVWNFKIVNIWASTRLPWDIKILSFAQKNKDCRYEPELSKSISYEMKDPKVTAQIFSSGSLVMQAPVLNNIHSAIRDIYQRSWFCKTKRKEKKEVKVGRKKVEDKLWRV